MVNEFFANNQYMVNYNSFKSLVDTAVQSDTKKFFTYTQFQNALTSNYSVGSYSVPGIQNLMAARVAYLQSPADFTAATPTISGIAATVSTPTLNSAVTITANVTNVLSNGVYLGYRFALSEKFVRVSMYDDGAHNDGIAGDNVYGSTFTLIANQAQYYIYAENTGAGIFSPERAEHEFYSLYAVQPPLAGQVVINEFLANNLNDATNEFNNHEDWIELYNTTQAPVSLGGYYLSDDYSNKTKYSFPQNTVILPNSFLILWADTTAGTSQMHTGFRLNEAGEKIIISNGLTNVIDSITFGAQTVDVSTGRCPNGTGSFAMSAFNTFSATNCVTGIESHSTSEDMIALYPNPARDFVTIKNYSGKTFPVKIYNATGQLICEEIITDEEKLNTSSWVPGIYFVKCNGPAKRFVITN